MASLRWVKASLIQLGIFLFFCIVSNLGFWVYHHTLNDIFFGIGLIGMYFWMINPFPLIFSVIGLIRYMADRAYPKNRELIGRKWLWLVCTLIGSVLAWMCAGAVMVSLTGGV